MTTPATDPTRSASATRVAPVTRVAIVGCGIIGKHHARVLSRHPAFTVTALVDPDPAATEAAAAVLAEERAPAAKAFTDLDQAVGGADVDLVAIATPSGMHVGHGRQALALGKHVVIEKPLDVDLAAARAFAEAVKAAPDQRVSVISQHRFDPANIVVKQAVDAGRLGTITSGQAATTWYRSKSYYDAADWRGTWAMDGGAVLNQGVHTVDLLRWLLGVPVSIYAQADHRGHAFLEVEDTAAATVRFENGAIATILATSSAYPGLTTRVTIGGTGGATVVENDRLGFFYAGRSEDAGTTNTLAPESGPRDQSADMVDQANRVGAAPDAQGFVNGHHRQYDDIAAALAEGRDPGVTVDEALLSLALVRGIYVSATLGRPIEFADLLNGDYDDVVPDLDGRTA